VRVPADNLLGGAAIENKGFICLMEQLPWERLQIAIRRGGRRASSH
jgi:alkylation response protein AidB-like acyl-CoA dehydrogenase